MMCKNKLLPPQLGRGRGRGRGRGQGQPSHEEKLKRKQEMKAELSRLVSSQVENGFWRNNPIKAGELKVRKSS